MADAKHTPGPWEAGVPGNGAPGYVYCKDATGSAVAKCCLEHVRRSGTEIEANARLISAAPDLLAACEELLNWAKDPASDLAFERYDYAEDFTRIATRARAAISKATGEA